MDPYVGQVAAFGFDFAPRGWAQCNGQLMQISQNTALFSLLGTQFGGDGRTTFALPDLRGRVAVHQGSSTSGSTYMMGEMDGIETVTLTENQMPQHSHVASFRANAEDANSGEANGKTLGLAAANIYNSNPPENGETLSANSITLAAAGSNQPHSNMQPYLAINYCISLQGIFPPRG
jgi:microcystin-dependent protein